eukprot:1859718-Amphidinium_carterae.1
MMRLVLGELIKHMSCLLHSQPKFLAMRSATIDGMYHDDENSKKEHRFRRSTCSKGGLYLLAKGLKLNLHCMRVARTRVLR